MIAAVPVAWPRQVVSTGPWTSAIVSSTVAAASRGPPGQFTSRVIGSSPSASSVISWAAT